MNPTLDPLAEAIEILETWMLSKNRPAGCGRLHRLLSRVRDDFFLAEDDVVELTVEQQADVPF